MAFVLQALLISPSTFLLLSSSPRSKRIRCLKHRNNYCTLLISKYRNELMELGVLFILLCHTVDSRVAMPYLVERIAKQGDIGVDIKLHLK